jgi:hypothetical protein
MRRFTRLINAFSKKIENHAAAVALHFIHYNFARVHKTLRITPAMAAGIADHVWSYEEIALFSSMKTSIHIAYLRRKIRQLEADWPLFLRRIADYTPEQKQLATTTFQSAMDDLRAQLQELLTSTNSNRDTT